MRLTCARAIIDLPKLNVGIHMNMHLIALPIISGVDVPKSYPRQVHTAVGAIIPINIKLHIRNK